MVNNYLSSCCKTPKTFAYKESILNNKVLQRKSLTQDHVLDSAKI